MLAFSQVCRKFRGPSRATIFLQVNLLAKRTHASPKVEPGAEFLQVLNEHDDVASSIRSLDLVQKGGSSGINVLAPHLPEIFRKMIKLERISLDDVRGFRWTDIDSSVQIILLKILRCSQIKSLSIKNIFGFSSVEMFLELLLDGCPYIEEFEFQAHAFHSLVTSGMLQADDLGIMIHEPSLSRDISLMPLISTTPGSSRLDNRPRITKLSLSLPHPSLQDLLLLLPESHSPINISRLSSLTVEIQHPSELRNLRRLLTRSWTSLKNLTCNAPGTLLRMKGTVSTDKS